MHYMNTRTHSKGGEFWNKEYRSGNNLALSDNPSSDLERFMRWYEREQKEAYKHPEILLDIGCGNGRNLIYLAKNYGLRGHGYDISKEAIDQAKKKSDDLPLEYSVLSMTEPIPLPDNSVDLVLDMMSSHFLNEEGRSKLLAEISRVLRPGGWFFWKTFLLTEDKNAQRLIHDHPAGEKNSYIHPKIGVLEHVFTEGEIEDLLESDFFVHRMVKSHRHKKRGKANKRRSISVYAQRTS